MKVKKFGEDAGFSCESSAAVYFLFSNPDSVVSHASYQAATLLLYHAAQLRIHSLPHANFLGSALVLIEALRCCGAATPRAERYATTLQNIFQSFSINGIDDDFRIKAAADVLHEILRAPFTQPQIPGTGADGILRPVERRESVDDESHDYVGDAEEDINMHLKGAAKDAGGRYLGEGGGSTFIASRSQEVDSDDELIEELLNRPDQRAGR